MIAWRCDPFAELTPKELYEVMALRQRVFVVEQRCPYVDADGWDPKAWHLNGWDEQGALRAHARLFGPDVRYPGAASIGRVVTAPESRGTGLGRELMRESIARIERAWGRVKIKIMAQAYLRRFYAELGFEQTSDEFLEDGIPHIDMVRA